MIASILPRLMPSTVSRRDPGGHRSRVAVDLPVGEQVQVRVEQAPVDPFQRQPSLAAFTNDLQYGFGVSHLAYLTVLVDREHLCPFALWTAFPSSRRA